MSCVRFERNRAQLREIHGRLQTGMGGPVPFRSISNMRLSLKQNCQPRADSQRREKFWFERVRRSPRKKYRPWQNTRPRLVMVDEEEALGRSVIGPE